jgi:hypothetical protein
MVSYANQIGAKGEPLEVRLRGWEAKCSQGDGACSWRWLWVWFPYLWSEVVGLTVAETAFGGTELVAVMRREKRP